MIVDIVKNGPTRGIGVSVLSTGSKNVANVFDDRANKSSPGRMLGR
jgi:hypothetical protein